MDEAKIQQIISSDTMTTIDKHIQLNRMKRVPFFGLLYPWERQQVFILVFYVILVVVLLALSVPISNAIARTLLTVSLPF